MAIRDSKITVEFARVPGYPKERITLHDIEVVDMLQCIWSDRITLAKQLLGFRIGDILYSPHEYNFGDEPIRSISCRDVSIEPLQIGIELSESGVTYVKARLSVVYNNLPYSEPETGVVYVTESLEPAAEFITLNNEKLYWDDDDDVNVNEAPNKIIRMTDWVYTIHQIRTIPSWVWTHPGTVNDSSITSRELNRTFPTGTLLCGNPSLSREITSEGTTAWSITVRLTYKATLWNRFPRSDKTTDNVMQFDYMYKAKGGASGDRVEPYDSENFRDIII